VTETAILTDDGIDRQQGSIPNYKTNNLSRADGHVWNATSAPPTATAALEQLEGSLGSTIHPAPHRIVAEASASSRSTNAASPIDMILTCERVCNYVPLQGEGCGMDMSDKSPRFIARHWLTCHAMREIMLIEKKDLDMSQASVINSPARLRVARRYGARCPFDFCNNAASGTS
jgi:hypothetical protein